MTTESADTLALLERAAAGDQHVWSDVVGRFDGRLKQMVQVRIDPRLQRRLAASDIIQESYLEAARHLADYLRDPKMPFYLWLRGIAANKLLHHQRQHLKVGKRDARREMHLGDQPATNCGTLADLLADRATRPSQAVLRAELQRRLQDALEQLEPIDHEIVSMRHFEQLSNAETALILNIDQSAASKRYIRALKRLKTVLAEDGVRPTDL
jgi:RNA polymerase sigma-70 factor (ECF subfamily)